MGIQVQNAKKGLFAVFGGIAGKVVGAVYWFWQSRPGCWILMVSGGHFCFNCIVEQTNEYMKPEDAKKLSPDGIRALHTALTERKTYLNQLLWQAPMIALTARAFLLTIAFDPARWSFYCKFSGLLAFFVGVLSWQLFRRHSTFELQTSKDLETLENSCFHTTVNEDPLLPEARGSARLRSRPLWGCFLFLVGFCGMLPIILPILGFAPKTAPTSNQIATTAAQLINPASIQTEMNDKERELMLQNIKTIESYAINC